MLTDHTLCLSPSRTKGAYARFVFVSWFYNCGGSDADSCSASLAAYFPVYVQLEKFSPIVVGVNSSANISLVYIPHEDKSLLQPLRTELLVGNNASTTPFRIPVYTYDGTLNISFDGTPLAMKVCSTHFSLSLSAYLYVCFAMPYHSWYHLLARREWVCGVVGSASTHQLYRTVHLQCRVAILVW
jgi:hypothetical protein